ncbi:hypothetical protein [Sediminibacter sp. Hel_I_10]|uniref:hypothetical protein n=1 Tax=Sediminibacter sp. Hel_I_10 TaxID=1392490 RepID=UPI0004793D94|nr:hypothetical protein [Sediminibacter sp. Hel_I_10]
MKITQTRYSKWLSAEDMHNNSQEWLSELNFIKDEHLFYQNLINSLASEIAEENSKDNYIEIIDILNTSQKQNQTLIKAVNDHQNELEVMLDGIDQIKEEKMYVKVHTTLIATIAEFLKEYKLLKTQLFDIIKTITKDGKQRDLMDKK